jgi:hypothetical protein
LDFPLLFKYCDPQSIDILEHLRLKVTPPIKFNDPFEFMPKIDTEFSRASVARQMSGTRLLKRIWRETPSSLDFDAFRELYLRELQGLDSRHVRNALRDLQRIAVKAKEGILAHMSKSFVMACYSEVNDDILMWAHYARSHHGFVVGFKVKHDFFKRGGNLVPVVYRSERVNATFGHGGLAFREPVDALLRSKSPHWSYECEWRQFFSIRKTTKARTESGKLLYFQKLPPRAIGSIILGFRCEPETEARIRAALSRRSLQHVQVRRAVLHDRDFRLSVIDA